MSDILLGVVVPQAMGLGMQGGCGRDAQDLAEEAVARRFRLSGATHPLLSLLRRRAVDSLAQALRDGASCEPPAPRMPLPPEVTHEANAGLVPGDIDGLAERARLPALPQVFLELQHAMEREEPSYEELAAIISKDPRLAASLLRLVNGPLFAFRAPVETVTRAVAAAGTRRVTSLALGTFVLGLFRERPPHVVNLHDFWLHSVATALMAQALAARLGRDDPERYFVAGLLHDMGWLAICAVWPAGAERVLDRCRDLGQTLTEAERAELGMTHGELGAAMLRRWNLPAVLLGAVCHHHAPSESPASDEALLVHLADEAVKGFGFGGTGDDCVQPLDLDAVAACNISAHDLDAACDALLEGVDEMYAVLGAGARG
ncbi:HDOD domain-containing protein [Nitratidesulfovibrio sp. HK-II]|uniref:HDOD domain-containing protein n=1 Tax=Nitratidesulfovibrio sp. HK-II TaxID=2009266 RepID=UPI001E5727F4|nr:HDOD domain-containing protein [Nitratidesulfovibrio sp. HK-II]